MSEAPAPEGILFDVGGTLCQVATAPLAESLAAHGAVVPTERLLEAFWQTAVLLDTEFAPTAGTFGGWWPRWLARFAQHAGVPEALFAEAYTAADAEQFLWCDAVPGAAEALARLRSAGVRIGAVSNADGRIDTALERAGLLDLLEVVVDSGNVGVEKPDPAIFAHAMGPMGLDAASTWYVGDTVAYDAAGAEAAGLCAWVVDHAGLHSVPWGRRIADLDALVDAALAHR